MGRVEGKVALITGAGRGIGRSMSLRLAEEGCDIIAIDIGEEIEAVSGFTPAPTPEDLEETARGVRALGRRVEPIKVDVRDYTTMKRQVDSAVALMGHLVRHRRGKRGDLPADPATPRSIRGSLGSDDGYQRQGRVEHHPGDRATSP